MNFRFFPIGLGSAGLWTFPAAAQAYRDGWGMWHDGWGMLGGGLVMLLFWVAVIALVVVLVKRLPGGERERAPERPGLSILEERFARGEIGREEFEEKRKVLFQSPGRPAA